MAARSKAWVCGPSLAGIMDSNPTGGHGCLSFVSVVCCQVIEKNEMGGACGAYGGGERCAQGSGWET